MRFSMSMTCITCGSKMPDISEFCPSCGRAVQLVVPTAETKAPQPLAPPAELRLLTLDEISAPILPPAPPVALNDRLVAAAAYCTFLPAIAFLFIKPYSARRFVRFHSLQSVFFWVVVAVLLAIGVIASTFGFLLLWLFAGTLVVLGLSLTWLVLSIKALQGEWFRLPALGDVCSQMVSPE